MHQDPKDIYEIEEASKCLKFLRLLWKFCRCIFSHVTLVSMVVAYCVLGAYAFESLEAAHELQVKDSIKYVRSNITKRIWLLTEESEVLRQENWTKEVLKHLVKFEADLLDKMKKEGWDGSEEMKNIQWTFVGALFYSIIVITTIGYGHIAPKTQNGKVVTIFYAILGIPLMLLCLSNIGDVMASSFRFLYWKICCYVCTRPPKPRRHRHHPNVLVRSQSLRQPGRYSSNRSTNVAPGSSSFRRSMRAVSQRSADSALPPSAFSDSIARSSRPDNEFNNSRNEHGRCDKSAGFSPSQRYLAPLNDDVNERAGSASVPSSSMKHRLDSAPIASPRILRLGTRYPVGTRSLDRKCRPIASSSNDAERTPVLFNRYAIDGPDFVEDRRFLSPGIGRRVDETSARRCRSVEASVDLEMLHRPSATNIKKSIRTNNPRAWSNKREASSARIMSPMGFAVHRQIYVDNLDHERDYLTSGGLEAGYYHEHDDPSIIKPVPIWLCVFLVVSYILGGAVLFADWETWEYLDSAYFCFITLTTIGFGDLVPAQGLKDGNDGIALCSLYLLFGIALLAMSFNLVQEEVINNVKNVAKSLGIIKDEDHGGGGGVAANDDDEIANAEDYYESDDYPELDRVERSSSRRCYNSEYDRSTGDYCDDAGDDFSGDPGSSRRDYYQHERSAMASRFGPR